MPNKNGAQGRKGALREVFSKKLKIRLSVEGGTLGAVLGASELMKICHCSRSTAYRWISGRAIIPKAEMELIHIKALGLIPHPKWNGFRVDKDGILFTPEDYQFTSETIRQFQQTHQANNANLKVIRDLKKQIVTQSSSEKGVHQIEPNRKKGHLPKNVILFKKAT